MFRKFFVVIACASLLAFAADDPVAAIKKKDAELQTLLKKASRNAKETERVKSLLNDSFDFAEFQRMVRNSSAKRLELYRADSTVYEAPKMKGDSEARVTAHLWNAGKESVLEYKMSLVNGNWKAWDLVIDDLSTARNYKDQFSQILKNKSFAELIDIISKKADEAEK